MWPPATALIWQSMPDRRVDRLPQVLRVVGTAEGARQAGRRERERQDLIFEVADLRVRFHQGPCAALDLGQGLQDLGPGAAEDLDVGAGS